MDKRLVTTGLALLLGCVGSWCLGWYLVDVAVKLSAASVGAL